MSSLAPCSLCAGQRAGVVTSGTSTLSCGCFVRFLASSESLSSLDLFESLLSRMSCLSYETLVSSSSVLLTSLSFESGSSSELFAVASGWFSARAGNNLVFSPQCHCGVIMVAGPFF